MGAIDMAGNKYGRLTVVSRNGSDSGNIARWLCVCSCGKETTVNGSSLRKGLTKSCGCIKTESLKGRATHRMGKTKTYGVWSTMLDRCNNKKAKTYNRYGGRGIYVCKRWHDFELFFADMGEKPDGLTLERIDNNAGYYPENCKWATRAVQARNTSATRLNEVAVRVIRYLVSTGRKQRDIAKAHGVSNECINKVALNLNWQGV